MKKNLKKSAGTFRNDLSSFVVDTVSHVSEPSKKVRD